MLTSHSNEIFEPTRFLSAKRCIWIIQNRIARLSAKERSRQLCMSIPASKPSYMLKNMSLKVRAIITLWAVQNGEATEDEIREYTNTTPPAGGKE